MTYRHVRWGLLLIAEEGYGRRLRGAGAEEDDVMQRSREALGG